MQIFIFLEDDIQFIPNDNTGVEIFHLSADFIKWKQTNVVLQLNFDPQILSWKYWNSVLVFTIIINFD